jgi:hypothetical protein
MNTHLDKPPVPRPRLDGEQISITLVLVAVSRWEGLKANQWHG